MTIESRLTLLKAQLVLANDKITKAEKSVERAENKLENAQYKRDCIIYEIDREMIESWAGKPDWNVLLENSDLHSSLMYDYTNTLFEKMGLSSHGTNIYTDQRAINLGFSTTSQAELLLKENAISFIVKYVIPHQGRKSFSIFNTNENDCAYSLSIEDSKPDAVVYHVERLTWGTLDSSLSFNTLRSALQHVQLNVCATDLVQEHDKLDNIVSYISK